jgi:hypothetical protein
VTRSNLSRILNGHAGSSAVMSVPLVQGDAVYVSRVLARDAAQLRSLEGSEKQAAQSQTVSRPAAKGACLSPDLTFSPTYSKSRKRELLAFDSRGVLRISRERL